MYVCMYVYQISCWRVSLQVVHYNDGKIGYLQSQGSDYFHGLQQKYKPISTHCKLSTSQPYPKASNLERSPECPHLSATAVKQEHQYASYGKHNAFVDVSDQDTGTERVMRKKIYSHHFYLGNCKFCILWVKISFSISTKEKKEKKQKN